MDRQATLSRCGAMTDRTARLDAALPAESALIVRHNVVGASPMTKSAAISTVSWSIAMGKPTTKNRITPIALMALPSDRKPYAQS